MSKKRRNELKKEINKWKSQVAQDRRNRAVRDERFEQALQGSFQKPGKKDVIEKILHKFGNNYPAAKTEGIVRVVHAKAPKLLVEPYIRSFPILAGYPYYRDLQDWEPKAKGKDTIFRSLCDHLIGKYPTPAIFWEALLSRQARIFAPLVIWVANGGSLFKGIKEGKFHAPPLTKKMCHIVVTSSSKQYDLMTAIRRAQVLAHNGHPRLLGPIMANRNLNELMMTGELEEFYDTIIHWLCRQAMLDTAQIGPLLDYIHHRWGEDNNFSISGRSPLALLRGMEEWHKDLNAAQRERQRQNRANGRSPWASPNIPETFKPSGLKEKIYTETTGKKGKHTWFVEEILTNSELRKEGAAMHHCVASYAYSISCGAISIWSLQLDGAKAATIEVDNRGNMVRQARGYCNKELKKDEFEILVRWASANALRVKI